MKKVPSEWTPQEAWAESAKRHCHLWGLSPYENQCDAFPVDPPERVSDDELRAASTRELGIELRDRLIKTMALELIERRKAEKEQGR